MIGDAHQPRQGHLTISRGRRRVQEGMPASITSAPVSDCQALSVFSIQYCPMFDIRGPQRSLRSPRTRSCSLTQMQEGRGLMFTGSEPPTKLCPDCKSGDLFWEMVKPHRCNGLVEQLAVVGLHNQVGAIPVVCDRISKGNKLFGRRCRSCQKKEQQTFQRSPHICLWAMRGSEGRCWLKLQ